MHHLRIDIETYSSEEIKKTGLYRYVQSPDFQILLFAYAFDDGPVQIVDLTATRYLPQEVLAALFNPDVQKHAYNAAFEWYCLSKHFGLTPDKAFNLLTWLPQWHCTQLHGLYCGYPAGLAAIGDALGLSGDKRKLAAGNALIRTFCTPTTPSRNNGYRTRTLPHHEPERWELFKEYCVQDVEAEREVGRKLRDFPLPEEIRQQWVLDITIGHRGVQIDTELAAGAIACNDISAARLTKDAKAATGLENPGSVQQLLRWLAEEGEELPDLQKKTVAKTLKKDGLSDNARYVLALRKELAKTSVKKYASMLRVTCEDGRARGILQFYGAPRTGRWAGRGIQPQNLPHTLPTEKLPLARRLVKDGNATGLQLAFGSAPEALSQLIRTGLVAPPGKTLISADFSAIEARVIAWFAKEQWRLDVFATHGKIYEASASAMFGIPIEKISKGNPEYSFRQRGKVAELALGYQGGKHALITMGALDKGLTEEELPDIVQRWRQANRRIVDFWYAVESAAKQAVQTGWQTTTHGVLFTMETCGGTPYLTIVLPSGRKLFYARPAMGVNRWGGPSINYWGVNDKKKWAQLDTYGGKLVENIVQATARDCLSDALIRVAEAGYQVVFHVHDEIIVEADKQTAPQALEHICRLMAVPLIWAPDLLLRADGYVSEFYKKD